MNKYGWPEERVGDVLGDLVRQREEAKARIAELTAEVARLRKVIETFDYTKMSMEELKERATSPSVDGLLYAMAIDARNALKDGV